MDSRRGPAKPGEPIDIDQLATAWLTEFLEDLRQDWAGRLHFEDDSTNLALQDNG